jgi:predicted ATPase
LIGTIGRTLVDLPVLMLLVYRPWEPHSANMPRVSQLPHFTEVQLAELGPQEAERLIALKLEQWMGCEAEAAPGFVERITHQAAGNPFYIEELLNYLQDRGIRPGDRESLAQLDLPSTLYSLILSRMDQLAESQQTLMKVASVIGRSFRAAMVWGVYPQLGSIELVRAELQALNEQDLVLLDRPEPELSYLFKHVITQEVAYESLPYSTRAMLHEQIGRYIEATYHATLEQYVNLLSFHYEHSENTAKKREYLLKAAEAAQADYANAAAIDYYEKLLPLLPAEEKVPVLLQLGKVLELTGQWQIAGDRYEQALALAEELGDLTWKAWSDAAMAELLRKQGQYSAATTWLERARDGFQALNDEAGVGQVLHIWGSLAAQQTDLETARARYEDSLAVRQKLKDQSNTAALLSNLGIVARIRGDHAEAQVLHEQALALRHELGDKWAIANSLINLGNVHLDRGDYGAARSQLEEAVALLREIGDRQAIANALHSLGSVTREQGDYLASRDCYRESLTVLWELRDTWLLAHLLEDIGGLAATQGEPERALQLAAAAAALRETIGAPLSTAYQEKLDRMLKPSRQMLGEAGAEKAMTQGRTKTLEQAIEYAFETLVGSDSVSKRGETG